MSNKALREHASTPTLSPLLTLFQLHWISCCFWNIPGTLPSWAFVLAVASAWGTLPQVSSQFALSLLSGLCLDGPSM